MKKTEENKVGILLACGFTKKEIAIRLHKSVHTVTQQTRRLYERSGSRNLADITRYIISSLMPGADIDSMLRNALGIALFIGGLAIIALASMHPGWIEEVGTPL